MCELQKRALGIGEKVVIFGQKRNNGRYVTNMKLLLLQNGQEIYDLLKEIHEVFKNNCCVPCSKCHELQDKVEAVLDAVEDRVYIQMVTDVNGSSFAKATEDKRTEKKR